MSNSINASELLYKISITVGRIEDNCEEKQGVDDYCLYDDIIDVDFYIS